MRLSGIIIIAALLVNAAMGAERPLDNITSRQYQHEIRPLRLALDRWLHELGRQA